MNRPLCADLVLAGRHCHHPGHVSLRRVGAIDQPMRRRWLCARIGASTVLGRVPSSLVIVRRPDALRPGRR